MRIINEHIKNNQFKNVYLIYGEENYLVQQYKNKLKASIAGDDTMNYAYFEGRKIDVTQLIDTCNTLPFFAERRLVIVEDSGFFKAANDTVTDYIKNIPEYLIVVFVENEVDKRNRLFKTVSDKGYVCEMKYQDEATLTRWIVDMLGRENKKISKAALALLLDKCGVEMENIHSEMEKLICYCYNKEAVEDKDVEAICTNRTVGKIFDMVTAIASHNQKKALELYYDLLLVKEPPMKILYLITRQFNQLLQVKELSSHHIDNKTMAQQMGIAPFLVGKYLAQAKGFSSEALRTALYDMADMEEAVKTGNMQENLAVELIIIKYSRKETA